MEEDTWEVEEDMKSKNFHFFQIYIFMPKVCIFVKSLFSSFDYRKGFFPCILLFKLVKQLIEV